MAGDKVPGLYCYTMFYTGGREGSINCQGTRIKLQTCMCIQQEKSIRGHL